MTFARIARWLAGLALLSTIEFAAFAGPAEISGIDKIYLRSGPGTDTAPVTVLNAGDQVNIIGGDGSWTKVETQDGTVGFVSRRYVVPRVDGSPAQGAPQPVAPASNVAAAPGATPPAPPPTATEGAPQDELSAELTGLRAEVADLKQKVQAQGDQTGEVQAPSGAPLSAPLAPASAPSGKEQGIGVLTVAFLSLLVGWVLGSAFARRRPRSQRPRLRL
jgi:hypothetical protein